MLILANNVLVRQIEWERSVLKNLFENKIRTY